MTATRRLATIMAIDVVGYSRLLGEDEAGTALAVRAVIESIVAVTYKIGKDAGGLPTLNSG